ncbi:MAG TPA: hypothetical protein VFI50_12430 [Casimicrobiaceae bacterium]|nr:hypothetical protein [Casimicrobiaceae bacterium]
MSLDVKPVLQPQRAELVLGKLAAKETARLIAELRDAFAYKAVVEVVVAIHGRYVSCART